MVKEIPLCKERTSSSRCDGEELKLRVWKAKVGFLRATCSSPLMLIHVDHLLVEKK